MFGIQLLLIEEGVYGIPVVVTVKSLGEVTENITFPSLNEGEDKCNVSKDMLG